LDWLDDYGKKYGIRFTVTISTDIRGATSGVMKYLQA
jgi:hypothetical protein